ncbi:MAG: methyl-accepting chemotaxis protein [Hyphomicrobiales bacterium]
MFNLSKKLNNVKISIKMPILIVLSATVLALGLGFLSYSTASKVAIKNAEDAVLGVLENRKATLNIYLHSIQEDIISVASNPFTYQAEKAFHDAWLSMGDDVEKTLQDAYINNNPHPLGSKEKLDVADTGTIYDSAHATYHPWFRTFLEKRGYYDIFLFDLEGNLVYSVFKELDYATNVITGKYKDTDLGNAFRAAAGSSTKESLHFFDFKPYSPSHGAPASFLSTPLINGDGEKTGVLVFQMPIERINAVMTPETGLGESGETFLVGTDNLVRSASRFINSDEILQKKVESSAIRDAFDGKIGFEVTTNYRKGSYEITAEKVSFNGVNWAMVAAINKAEIVAPVIRLRNEIIIEVLVLLSIIGAIGYWVSNTITRPLSDATKVMEELSKGNTDVEVNATERGDEVGDIARALQVFRDTMNEKAAADLEREGKRQADRKRTERIESRINVFSTMVSDLLESFAKSSQGMKDSSVALSAIAEQTNSQAGTVSESASAAASNIQTVSTASEQLRSSIAAIANDAEQSRSAAEAAVGEVENANQEVSGLVSLAEKVGDVVTLISDIAEQTNLLALNATIEAARAGEMGKGFAVVATEVKELASQTAKATEEISQQIGDIRIATGNSVSAIEKIGEVVEQVNTSSSAIASAVQQQDSATSNIAQNMIDVAKRTENVTESIGDVTRASQDTGKMANDVLEAAGALADQSSTLQSEITSFLDDIRAA